jgi:hypothetical protein
MVCIQAQPSHQHEKTLQIGAPSHTKNFQMLWSEMLGAMERTHSFRLQFHNDHKNYVVILGFMTKYKLEFDFFYFAILFFFSSGLLALCCRFFIVGLVIVPGVNDYCLAVAQILVMLSPL